MHTTGHHNCETTHHFDNRCFSYFSVNVLAAILSPMITCCVCACCIGRPVTWLWWCLILRPGFKQKLFGLYFRHYSKFNWVCKFPWSVDQCPKFASSCIVASSHSSLIQTQDPRVQACVRNWHATCMHSCDSCMARCYRYHHQSVMIHRVGVCVNRTQLLSQTHARSRAQQVVLEIGLLNIGAINHKILRCQTTARATWGGVECTDLILFKLSTEVRMIRDAPMSGYNAVDKINTEVWTGGLKPQMIIMVPMKFTRFLCSRFACNFCYIVTLHTLHTLQWVQRGCKLSSWSFRLISIGLAVQIWE